ncbi:MAG: hypothetical protein IJR70_01235 [Eubacterium sp.]|nr:hypothetical protein [Eubacterium sp.]
MDTRINPNIEYQTFEGIGASGAWWAQEVGGWESRDEISSLLFSKENGIGLRTYRYNLGGGSKESGRGDIDNPLRRGECFENEKGEYDFSKDENAVYMMKQAVKDGADEVIFFVNSPIERLTKNHKAHCDKGFPFKENLDKENYRAFAKYVLDVTEHFLGEGIPIKYISPINEPFWKWTGGQEGCHYRPKSAGEVMKVFSDEMNKRDAFENVMLSGVENGDIRWFNKSYTRNLFKYESVKKRIDSVDLHSYFLMPFKMPFIGNRVGYLKRYRKWLDKKYPNTSVKMSEWTHMQGGRDKTMNSALVMAKVMYEDMSILNVTSWQHWIAVSEVDYCDGLIYINLDDKSYEMTKRYYATGNFSKFIPFGAKRIEVSCDDSELMLLAFRKDEKTVLIVINETPGEKELNLNCDAKMYVTNETDNLKEYSVSDVAKITPKSVNTIVMG